MATVKQVNAPLAIAYDNSPIAADLVNAPVTVILRNARITPKSVIMAKCEHNGNKERWFNMVATPTMPHISATDAKPAGQGMVAITTTRRELATRGMMPEPAKG